MASNQIVVDFILEQISEAGIVSARKMFGEYGLYCDGKIIALICDDLLFVKPTKAGLSFVGDCPEACPYPGAKPYLQISKEKWDDREWLSTLFRISAEELPLPTKKKTKKCKKLRVRLD